MVVGILLGLLGSRWLWYNAADGTLLPRLPSASGLLVSALTVLATGWLLAAVVPRAGAGLASGLVPGVTVAALSIDHLDGERATGLFIVAVALLAVAVGCALEGYRHPHGPVHT